MGKELKPFVPTFREESFISDLKQLGGLSEKVRELIVDNIGGELAMALVVLDKCESPIEQMMAIALDRQLDNNDDVLHYFVGSQVAIETEGGKYRADFLVEANVEGTLITVIVECDGHDYHEKTKKQAQRDKQRDRNIIATGIPTFRFTGSEIYHNPYSCARETIAKMMELAKKR